MQHPYTLATHSHRHFFAKVITGPTSKSLRKNTKTSRHRDSFLNSWSHALPIPSGMCLRYNASAQSSHRTRLRSFNNYIDINMYIYVYIYIYMRSAPTRTYLLWIHQTWTTFNHPVWTTSLCIPLPFCSELYPSTIHIVWTASLYYLVWTADFYWKEKGFLKGRLLSKQKSWIGQGRVYLKTL